MPHVKPAIKYQPVGGDKEVATVTVRLTDLPDKNSACN